MAMIGSPFDSGTSGWPAAGACSPAGAASTAAFAGKAPAAEVRLRQLALLDHGAHRAIQNDDPLAQEALKLFNFVRHQFMAI